MLLQVGTCLLGLRLTSWGGSAVLAGSDRCIFAPIWFGSRTQEPYFRCSNKESKLCGSKCIKTCQRKTKRFRPVCLEDLCEREWGKRGISDLYRRRQHRRRYQPPSPFQMEGNTTCKARRDIGDIIGTWDIIDIRGVRVIRDFRDIGDISEWQETQGNNLQSEKRH